MPFTGDPPFSATEATPAHQWAQNIAAGLVPRTVRRHPGPHGFRVETVHPEYGELYRGEIRFVRVPVTLLGAYMAWELSDPDRAPATDLVLACDYLTAETILLDRTSAWDAPATPQALADMARENDDEPTSEPDTHVYTAAELRNPTTRPRAQYDTIRVLAPFTAPRGPDAPPRAATASPPHAADGSPTFPTPRSPGCSPVMTAGSSVASPTGSTTAGAQGAPPGTGSARWPPLSDRRSSP